MSSQQHPAFAPGAGRSSPPAPGAGADTTRGRQAGWGLATSLGLLLAVIGPIVFSRPTLDSFMHAPVVLAFAITLYAAARLWLLLMAGSNRPISLTFWLFVYVFFGLAALANVVTQQFPLLGQTFAERTEIDALLTIVVGLAGYEVGRLAAQSRRVQERWTHRLNRPTVRIRRVTVIGLVGIITVTYFTVKYGLGTRFSSRDTATETFFGPGQRHVSSFLRQDKASGLLRIALDWIPIFVALYLLLCNWQVRRAHARAAGGVARWGLRRYTLLVALAVGVLLADNPFSGPRARFLGVAIALLLAVWPLVTPRRFRIFVAILVVGQLFVYPSADVFRNQKRVLHTASLSTQFRTNPSFGMFQQEVNAQVYVRDKGHTWGRQLVGVALGWVPRKYWSGKPKTTGELVFPAANQTIPTSLSIWGWAFVEGGMPWVFIVLAAYGWAAGLLESAYRRRPRDRASFAAVAAPLFAAFQTLVIRGELQTAVADLAPVALLVIVACGLRSRARHRSSGPSAAG